MYRMGTYLEASANWTKICGCWSEKVKGFDKKFLICHRTKNIVMIRSLIKFGLLLVVLVVGYNLIFGTEEEKAQSKEIISKGKDVLTEVFDFGKSAISLLKSEKGKFDEGKYDGDLDKLGDIFEQWKDKAEDLKDSELVDKIVDLERTRLSLEKEFQEKSPEGYDQQEQEKLKEDWEKLLFDTEEVMKNMEAKEK